MLQDWNLEEMTDGRKYSAKDMVRIGCNDCEGCSYCCHEVADTIILDPLDVYMLSQGARVDLASLFSTYLELRIVDGIVLPNLKIDEKNGCMFLSSEGRCSVHDFRTGFCRLYPLARVYEGDGFFYANLKDQCKSNRPLTKVKIEKWLGYANIKAYEDFTNTWHFFLRKYQDKFMADPEDDRQKEIVNLILKVFYLTPYNTDTYNENLFYDEFYKRLKSVKDMLEE